MRSPRTALAKKCLLSVASLALAALPAQAQFGPIIAGAGPVNRSMAGTAVATPIDGAGSLYWNPATSSALPGSSLDFGIELLHAPTTLASSINGLGTGSDRGDNGVFALPTVALIYRPDDSNFTYGLGLFSLAGFGVNYPSSTTNPILSPQPPFGVGLGSIYSNLQVLQIAPTVSVQLTDRLSIGGGPTVILSQLRADPLFVVAPNLNGQYPPGTHTRTTWGGGFQLGAFYKTDNCWQFGASFKGPSGPTSSVSSLSMSAAGRATLPSILTCR